MEFKDRKWFSHFQTRLHHEYDDMTKRTKICDDRGGLHLWDVLVVSVHMWYPDGHSGVDDSLAP